MLRIKMPISEIFHSLQWEGRNTWKSVVFVRFWGCNLHCTRCDSKYARHKDYKDEIKQMKFYEVIKKIKSLNCKHIVFTWWEPALYEPHIWDIQEELQREDFFGWTFEIETNGSRELVNYYDQINVSYKFKSSWNRTYELKANSNLYDYKFVIDSKEDIEEMENLIEQYNLPKDRIFIMPLWTTQNSQDRLDLARYCLENNYRYSPRQHILRFWDKRWV